MHSFPASVYVSTSEQIEQDRDDVSVWLPRASRDAAQKGTPKKSRMRSSNALTSDSESGAGVNAEVQGALKTLNEKINKLYAWHMIELDVVSRQQVLTCTIIAVILCAGARYANCLNHVALARLPIINNCVNLNNG